MYSSDIYVKLECGPLLEKVGNPCYKVIVNTHQIDN